jgi:tetratricopeptide (TPR) repeat protein
MRALALLVAAATLAFAAEEPHIHAAAAAYEAARSAQRGGQLQRAEDLFRNAIEIEPTFREAHEGLIRVNLDTGRRAEAAAAITRFLEIEPGAVQYRLVLGRILLELQQPERALAQFSILLGTGPASADALLGFASAAKRMGMQDRAQEALDRGRKLFPSDERFKTFSGERD